MRTRLEDLLANADRQLASRSYDAAIDTLRTALGEPGAVEMRVEDRLEAASAARDEARGIVRPGPPSTPPVVNPIAEFQATPQPEPVSAPAPPPAMIDERPIEPPSFHLIESEKVTFEIPGGQENPWPEPLSILNPTPPPEKPGDKLMDAIASALKFFS